MSELRIPDLVWIGQNASTQGKKPLRIELFRAVQWQCNWNLHRKTMYPHPPLSTREYWQQYYRLRVDGRWIGMKGYKYRFYTLVQALAVAERLFEERT
ncbi:MAG: hypothetical protein PHI97_27445 [Desulfobulbus sp.]|nr:hypothetical protein [Desulfobulbus sp.]